MRGKMLTLAVVLTAVLASALAHAQESPPSPKEVLLRHAQSTQKQLVELAEEFPEEKYGYRPNDEVRTFAEILLHVALANARSATRTLERTAPNVRDYRYISKAETIEKLKASFADVRAAIEKNPSLGWFGLIRHAAEHYGNLVVYYRLNGLVPPASR